VLIPKDQILELIWSRGDHDQAGQAASELPDQVDSDNDNDKTLLERFGIDPSQLMGNLGKKSARPGARPRRARQSPVRDRRRNWTARPPRYRVG
jgi:hypothetical protein